MFRKLLFGIVTLLFGLGLSNLNAQAVVVPNANEFVEGDSNNAFPFNSGVKRYQQIYESTQFSECNIVQVNFRFDENTPGDSETYPNILIQLSTTNVAPSELNSTFATNIGSDVTTVYDGELLFSAPDCGIGPCPFDNTITLQTPFNYNPRAGNLLLDITKPEDSVYQQFDAIGDSLPIMQRVFSSFVNAETGVVSGNGLVTQFVCESVRNVPTLSEWGIIAMAGLLGLVGFIVMRRRKVTA